MTGKTIGGASPAEEEIASLSEYSLAALKARWLDLKRVPLPKFMRRGLMREAVAHAIREAASGGLDIATQKRLDRLAAEIVPQGGKPPPRPNRIKVGTRLIREWQGRMHEVTAVEGGFIWKGERYPSLSVIARRITGTRWNGWVFFGLKQKAKAALAEKQARVGEAGQRSTGSLRQGSRQPTKPPGHLASSVGSRTDA